MVINAKTIKMYFRKGVIKMKALKLLIAFLTFSGLMMWLCAAAGVAQERNEE